MSFKLLAIRPLKGCDPKFLKNLKEDEIYQFYQDYRFDLENGKMNGNVINIEKLRQSVPDNFYGNENLNINISAIVGKNGSGKSALVELLYAVFYNVSIDLKIFKENNKKENIHCEIYYQRFNKDLSIIEFSSIKLNGENEIAILSNLNDVNEFDLIYDLFYNVVTNYSFYGLNSNFSGEWIEKLFHKNDGYQVPIVLNPMRTAGKIDINREYKLAKDRLLSNVLNSSNIDKNSKTLLNNKKVIGLKLNLKSKSYKLSEKEEIKKEEILKKYLAKILNSFKDDSGYEEDVEMTRITEILTSKNIAVITACNYILYKLKKMSSIYGRENTNFTGFDFLDEDSVDSFLNNILKYDFGSHITYKIRQVINFLKYDLYPKQATMTYYKEQLEHISDEIFAFRKKTLLRSQSKILEKNPNTHIIFPFWLLNNVSLIPPSIYDVDYEFEDGSLFSLLSSGETQKIFSISTILYHIVNISSKHHNFLFSDKDYGEIDKKIDIKYRAINIILDEIELYAHPEMQRTFTKELIDKLKNSYLSGIDSINLLFITHSPFILSDIPKQNVLFLEVDKEIQKVRSGSYEGKNTFGANIHEMLTNGFFMESTKGEFAISKINEFLEFYKLKDEVKLKQFPAKRDYFDQLIELIGEDYFRQILKNQFMELDEEFNPTYLKDKQSELAKQLKEVEDLIAKKTKNEES